MTLLLRKWEPAIWMAAAFGGALASGLAVLHEAGHGIWGFTNATQTVARIAFLFFWPTYAGGALATFFGPAFEGLARRRREFGLAFAAALFVHLCFVGWLYHISFFRPLPKEVALYFAIGALWTYGLALGSIKLVRDLLGPRLWWLFNAAGLEYIAYLFFRDFVLLPLQYGARHTLFYAPFAILIVAGALLRWSAMGVRRWRRVGPHPAPDGAVKAR